MRILDIPYAHPAFFRPLPESTFAAGQASKYGSHRHGERQIFEFVKYCEAFRELPPPSPKIIQEYAVKAADAFQHGVNWIEHPEKFPRFSQIDSLHAVLGDVPKEHQGYWREVMKRQFLSAENVRRVVGFEKNPGSAGVELAGAVFSPFSPLFRLMQPGFFAVKPMFVGTPAVSVVCVFMHGLDLSRLGASVYGDRVLFELPYEKLSESQRKAVSNVRWEGCFIPLAPFFGNVFVKTDGAWASERNEIVRHEAKHHANWILGFAARRQFGTKMGIQGDLINLRRTERENICRLKLRWECALEELQDELTAFSVYGALDAQDETKRKEAEETIRNAFVKGEGTRYYGQFFYDDMRAALDSTCKESVKKRAAGLIETYEQICEEAVEAMLVLRRTPEGRNALSATFVAQWPAIASQSG